MNKDSERKQVCCSFCGKGQDEVKRLIAGPGVYICDECIDICKEVLETDEAKEEKQAVAMEKVQKLLL